MINRTPVSSSMVKSIGLSDDEQVIEVEFRNGTVYTYEYPMTREEFNEMLEGSVGKFINSIKYR